MIDYEAVRERSRAMEKELGKEEAICRWEYVPPEFTDEMIKHRINHDRKVIGILYPVPHKMRGTIR